MMTLNELFKKAAGNAYENFMGISNTPSPSQSQRLTVTKPVPPRQPTSAQEWKNRLKAEEEAGYNEGSAGFNPVKWFIRPVPEWVTAPTPQDPKERELRESRLRGYQKAQRDDTHTVTGVQAQLSAKIPNTVAKSIDTNAGVATQALNMIPGVHLDFSTATSWSKAKDADDYKQEYVNQEADLLGNPYSAEGMAATKRVSDSVGKTFYTQAIADHAARLLKSPDPQDQLYGQFYADMAARLGNVEDASNQLVGKNALVNVLLGAGVPGGTAVKLSTPFAFGAIEPTVNRYMQKWFGRDFGLLTGTDAGAQEEKNYRLTYGDKTAERVFQQQFQLVGTDDNDQPVAFSVPETATREELEAALPHYDIYTQYLQEQGIPLDKMNDEDVKLDFVVRFANGGTPSTELFKTAMFRTLTPEHQIDAFETWMAKRYARDKETSLIDKAISGVKHLGNKADMLADAMRNDTTGIYAQGFNDFLMGADTDTIVAFFDRYSGGSGNSGDVDVILDAVRDGFKGAMKADPRKMGPMARGLVKLHAAQAARAGKDPSVSTKGAEMIKSAFSELLEDPDTFSNLSDKEKLDFLKTMVDVFSSEEGKAALGPEGENMASGVTANLQSMAIDLAKEHPEMWPEFLGLYLNWKGMKGPAEYISNNPWVFWAGLGTLLFGGVLLLGSVFDDDEVEEDEDADYRRALRRNPYA